MRYIYVAKIENEKIKTIICSENVDQCAELLGGNWVPVPLGAECGIGWTWDGERFMPPEIEEVQDEIN